MSASDPLAKIVVLVDRLIALQEAKTSVSDFELHRLQQEAQRLIPYAPGDAYMALGMVAALKGNGDAAIQAHERSLHHGWNTIRALNYAATLGGLHRPQEALEHLMRCLSQDVGVSPLPELLSALRHAYAAGRFHRVASLLEQYHPYVSRLNEEDVMLIKTRNPALVAAAHELGLTDDLMAAIHAPAWTVFRDLPRDLRISMDDKVKSDGNLFLSRTYQVPVSAEAGERLNEKMLDLIAQTEEDVPFWQFCVSIEGQGSS